MQKTIPYGELTDSFGGILLIGLGVAVLFYIFILLWCVSNLLFRNLILSKYVDTTEGFNFNYNLYNKAEERFTLILCVIGFLSFISIFDLTDGGIDFSTVNVISLVTLIVVVPIIFCIKDGIFTRNTLLYLSYQFILEPELQNNQLILAFYKKKVLEFDDKYGRSLRKVRKYNVYHKNIDTLVTLFDHLTTKANIHISKEYETKLMFLKSLFGTIYMSNEDFDEFLDFYDKNLKDIDYKHINGKSIYYANPTELKEKLDMILSIIEEKYEFTPMTLKALVTSPAYITSN